jgi:hypothetical protein
MSICDRGNALEKDVGKRQFFDRALYPPLPVLLALEAAPQPAWDVILFSWIQWAPSVRSVIRMICSFSPLNVAKR